ncbi:MAG: transcriptional regulator [Methylobacter sp.]|uniref:winged helix-turn-helix transcriptional regulator n=1 Tax=Methylovulum miyakonense TaxID=645578 RepID=UPI00036E0432|nr:helix-turn-helix domain-containing protein [Methylovulum miyakonense]PPD44346.1 MAG: transcriptional regulator [Methylobacter sp.]
MKTEPQSYRSKCPLSIALEFIGDKWSLIIIRDMCLGKSKYCDFQSSPEGIPTNILASRLRELEENGLLVKRPYQDKPVRYEYFLTPKGADLLPVLQHLVMWTQKHVDGCGEPPEGFFTAKPEDLLKRQERGKELA